MRIALLIFLALATTLGATTRYVRAGASGTGAGTSYTNAYTTVSAGTAAAVRGDVVYVAGGAYNESVTCDTATSGTTTITIKKATIADHGAAGDWSDAYDTQAVITSAGAAVTINSRYWIWDGNSEGTGFGATSYGFKLVTTGTVDDFKFCFGGRGNNITGTQLRYCELSAPAPNGSLGCLAFEEKTAIFVGSVSTGLIVEHNWIHGGLVCVCFSGNGPGGADQGDIFQYNNVEACAGQQHSEMIQLANTFDITIRYNVLRDLVDPSTAYIEPQQNGTSNPVPTGIYVYGNVFYAYAPGEGTENPSVLSMTAGEKCDTVFIVNNTFYGLNGSNNGFSGSNDTGVAFASGGVQSTNVTVKNNIWQSCIFAPGIGGTNVVAAANRLNTGTSASFTSAATGVFTLTADTTGITARSTVASPLNAIVDPNGTTYSTSIGAYQFVSSSAPGLSSATISSNGTTLTLVFTASVQNGAGGNAGVTITVSGGGSQSATYSSGSASTTLVYTVPIAYSGQSFTVSYVQPGNGIEATSDGTDVASFGPVSGTNNSTQTLAVTGGSNPSKSGVVSGSP